MFFFSLFLFGFAHVDKVFQWLCIFNFNAATEEEHANRRGMHALRVYLSKV